MSESVSSAEAREMAMFPLGSVLLPGGVLPLHVFEIRYQQLLNHVLESDRQFGVVLITRGFEVGGGETRAEIGTVAVVQDHQRFDDGRAAVVSHGAGRFQVESWLPDDPFPRAMVRELPEEPEGPNDRDLLQVAIDRFRGVLDLGRQLGRLESAPDPGWQADIEQASWQLAGRLPSTAHDLYRILAAETRSARLELIDQLLVELRSDLELMGPLNGNP